MNLMNLLLSLMLNLSSTFLLNAHPLNRSVKPMQGDLFEGDIVGVKIVNSTILKGYAQIENTQYGKWTGGIIPYKIEDYVYTQAQINTIYEAMRLIESQTSKNGRQCIKFQPRTSEQTYLKIYSDKGCFSYVGRQNWSGEQPLSIQVPSCVYKGIIAHELIHALGFWHEQSRIDRDNFITVVWGNIQSGQEHNFNKYDTSKADTLGFAYDYASIMHYEADAFSSNGKPTMIPKQSGVSLLPAWRKISLTPTDIAEIRKYYNCN